MKLRTSRSWLTITRFILLNSLTGTSQQINQRYHDTTSRFDRSYYRNHPRRWSHTQEQYSRGYYLNSVFRYRDAIPADLYSAKTDCSRPKRIILVWKQRLPPLPSDHEEHYCASRTPVTWEGNTRPLIPHNCCLVSACVRQSDIAIGQNLPFETFARASAKGAVLVSSAKSTFEG